MEEDKEIRPDPALTDPAALETDEEIHLEYDTHILGTPDNADNIEGDWDIRIEADPVSEAEEALKHEPTPEEMADQIFAQAEEEWAARNGMTLKEAMARMSEEDREEKAEPAPEEAPAEKKKAKKDKKKKDKKDKKDKKSKKSKKDKKDKKDKKKKSKKKEVKFTEYKK